MPARSLLAVATGISLLAGLGFGSATAAAQSLGYSQGLEQLFRVNVDTAEATPVGEPNGAYASGLAFDAEGDLFGILRPPTPGVPASGSALARFDTSTGEVSDVVILDGLFSDLTFDRSGRAWVIDETTLRRLDPATGATASAVNLGREPLGLVSRGLELYVFTTTGAGDLFLERVDGETGALQTLGEVSSGGQASGLVGSSFDAAGRLRFVTFPGGILVNVGLDYRRIDDLSAPVPEQTASAVYTFQEPEAGIRSLAMRGADTVVVPTLGSSGVLVLIFSLLIAALVVLRRG